MQSIKLKDGRELVSMEVDKVKAKEDIVKQLVKYGLENDGKLIREVYANLPHVQGAMVILRLVKEKVVLDECSKEFKELVEKQRELVDVLIGDKPVPTEGIVKLVEI